MVLEDITKEYTDAESNAQNRSSTEIQVSPSHQSTKQDTLGICCAEDTEASLATTLKCRGRSRSSFDSVRGSSDKDRGKQKRRRDSLPVISDLGEIPPRKSEKRTSGILGLLGAVRERENNFPDGFSMEICGSVGDTRLADLHERNQCLSTEHGDLNRLMNNYRENLKGAMLKFLDSPVGYILYVQTPSQIGVTSESSLDSLITIWVASQYQENDLERRILSWWLREIVRSVKYFSLISPASNLKNLVSNEGFKRPRPNTGSKEDYIAMI